MSQQPARQLLFHNALFSENKPHKRSVDIRGCYVVSTNIGGKWQSNAGYEYTFEIKDTLLGDGIDISMVKLRPSLISEFSGDNLTMLSKYLWQLTSISSNNISNEESMREYADLKLSLLLYNALLILAGSSIASFSAGENAVFAFLMGGISGFLYLLLLQRSVDELPAPSSSVNGMDEFTKVFGRFEVPLLILVLAFTFAVITAKYGSGDVDIALTPKDLMFGMLGFLACKVSVVLAAFIPMPIGLEENK